MAQHTYSVTAADSGKRIPLRGDMDVSMDSTVDASFMVGFLTEDDTPFTFNSTLGFLNNTGAVVNQLTVGGRPNTSVDFMFDTNTQVWRLVASNMPKARRLSGKYPWEIGFTPTIGLTVDQTTVTLAGNVNLTATVNDISLISKVDFYRNGVLMATDPTKPYTAADAITAAENGTVTYTAEMTNILGYTKMSDPVQVTVNIEIGGAGIPVISISSSSTNVTATGGITLTAQATDDVGVTHVEFYRNGQLLVNDTNSPFVATDTFTYADNGTIAYTAIAYDASNNAGHSNEVDVVVDIPVPATMPATRLDAATQAEYQTAINAAAVGSKRMAGATAIANAMSNDVVLNIYQNGFVVVPITYSGTCTVVDDGYDVYVQPPDTITGSNPNVAADLTQGQWWFELQGGTNDSRVLTGTVGNETTTAELTLLENPTPGQGVKTSAIKFIMPRSLDNLA